MKKIIHSIFFLVFTTGFMFAGGETYARAQQQAGPAQTIVRGTVTDRDTRETLVGVTVTEVDNDKRIISGTTTDFNGKFALKMKNPNNQITVSYIGYKSVTLTAGNQTELNVALVSATKTLDAVEIVAERSVNSGFMNIADRDRTGAVATVNAKDLEEIQASSIDQALQGRMAGVDIVANTGDPGAGMSIRIRGTSSINGDANPLIVLDGMPYDTEISADFNFATADQQGYAQLLNIAPSDIAEITVLKDAAATAVWGARASNGVLMITTKRGQKGAPSVNYSFRGTLSQQPDPIPMLNGDQYSTLIPEGFMNRFGTPLSIVNNKEFSYDPSDPYYYYNYNNNTDWIGAVTQLGKIHDHNVSLSGGGEKARYYTSLGYLGNEGTTVGTDLSRITARINLDYFVSDRIKFSTDISYTHVDRNANYTNSVRGVAYNKMPNMGIYEFNEYGEQTPNYFSPQTNIQGSWGGINSRREASGTFNPVAMANEGQFHETGERIIPTFRLNYEILPGRLFLHSDMRFDINNSKTKTFLPQTATGRPWTETQVNRASDYDVDNFNITSKTNLTYAPDLGEDHQLQTVVSFMSFDERAVAQRITTSNTPSINLTDPSAPSRIRNEGLELDAGNSQNRMVGLLFMTHYSLLDRYIISGSVRRDGSSKFGENNRWGTFPSISGRWRVSGEPFMQDITSINDLSLRGSYGASGNAPREDYGHFNNYSNFGWNYLGMSGVFPSTMELKNLKWETVVQSNLGLHLQLFDRRIGMDFDLYKRRTNDLFFRNLPISTVSGYSRVATMNVGVMDNQGWEFSMWTIPYQRDNLKVEFSFNLAQNENVIREISDLYPREAGNLAQNGQYLITIQENNPFGSFYGYKYEGVYRDAEDLHARDANGAPIVGPNGQVIPMRFYYPVADYLFEPGDAKYTDINNDGNIDHKDVVYLGNANPRLTGGFGPSITYGNWKLNMFFNFRYKFDIVNETRMRTENMYGYDNQSTAVLRRWRKPGDETDMPRALIGRGYNWLASDRYVEDGTFLRFKFITLRYNLPVNIAQKFGASNLDVFFTTENLLTFTNYSGQDPEVPLTGGDPFKIGFDQSRTPPTKNFTFGVNVRF